MSRASPSFILISHYHLTLCLRSNLSRAQMQEPSIKGRLTLNEVNVLDAVNLSARIQDAYLLRSSVSPIDTHTAFNRTIMDRPHVTNEGFEYRWSSCGAKLLNPGVAEECICMFDGLFVSICLSLCRTLFWLIFFLT